MNLYGSESRRSLLVCILVVVLGLALPLRLTPAFWLALRLGLGLWSGLIRRLRLASRLALGRLLPNYVMKTPKRKESDVIAIFILCKDSLVFYLENGTFLENLPICIDDFQLSHDKTYSLYP